MKLNSSINRNTSKNYNKPSENSVLEKGEEMCNSTYKAFNKG